MLDFLGKTLGSVLSLQQELDSSVSNASAFSKVVAWIIDFIIVAIPRVLVMVFANIFVEGYKQEFLQDVIDKYTSFFIFSTLSSREQVAFFFETKYGISIAVLFIVLWLIAIFYNVLMLTSSWGCTYGQRLAMIKVVKSSNHRRLGLFDSIVRTIFSYFPWFLPFVLIGMWDIFLPASILSLILLAFWYDISLFLNTRRSIHDILSGTVVINHKFSYKGTLKILV